MLCFTLGRFDRKVVVVAYVCPSVPLIIANTITQKVYHKNPPNMEGIPVTSHALEFMS